MSDMRVKSEYSLLQKVKEMLSSDAKMYYIFWVYYPEYLSKEIKSFDELKATYKVFTAGVTEDIARRWLSETAVQTAIKYVLERIHQSKMIELYSIYFEKSKTDTNAFKAFIEFSEKFFEGKKEDELMSILKGVSIEDDAEN